MIRDHNFSAGPAVLPISVIEELQNALPLHGGTGLGLMEMSHRSPAFNAIIESARNRLRRLMDIPKDWEILFLQGGASLQFYMSALNLLEPEEQGDYLNTGTWSAKAIVEANRCATAHTLWSPDGGVFNHVPSPNAYRLSANAKYLHYTSNNTIYGTQFHSLPESSTLADMRSFMLVPRKTWGPVASQQSCSAPGPLGAVEKSINADLGASLPC